MHALLGALTAGTSTAGAERVGDLGPLEDLFGAHQQLHINAARNLFRDEPIEVLAPSAAGHDERFDEVPESTSVSLRFPGGRLASFTCSFGASEVFDVPNRRNEGHAPARAGLLVQQGARRAAHDRQSREREDPPET